jgi:hypothetical protein
MRPDKYAERMAPLEAEEMRPGIRVQIGWNRVKQFLAPCSGEFFVLFTTEPQRTQRVLWVHKVASLCLCVLLVRSKEKE